MFKRLSIDFNSFLFFNGKKEANNFVDIFDLRSIKRNTCDNLEKEKLIPMIYGHFGITILCLEIACKWVCICKSQIKPKKREHYKTAQSTYSLWAAIVNTINCNCGCEVKMCIFFWFFFFNVTMEPNKYSNEQNIKKTWAMENKKKCMSSLCAVVWL